MEGKIVLYFKFTVVKHQKLKMYSLSEHLHTHTHKEKACREVKSELNRYPPTCSHKIWCVCWVYLGSCGV